MRAGVKGGNVSWSCQKGSSATPGCDNWKCSKGTRPLPEKRSHF